MKFKFNNPEPRLLGNNIVEQYIDPSNAFTTNVSHFTELAPYFAKQREQEYNYFNNNPLKEKNYSKKILELLGYMIIPLTKVFHVRGFSKVLHQMVIIVLHTDIVKEQELKMYYLNLLILIIKMIKKLET